MIDLQPSTWGLSGLDCVYFTAMAVGVMYALIVLMGGVAGDMDMSVDLDAESVAAALGEDFIPPGFRVIAPDQLT